jgi:hypothetical protein
MRQHKTTTSALLQTIALLANVLFVMSFRQRSAEPINAFLFESNRESIIYDETDAREFHESRQARPLYQCSVPSFQIDCHQVPVAAVTPLALDSSSESHGL